MKEDLGIQHRVVASSALAKVTKDIIVSYKNAKPSMVIFNKKSRTVVLWLHGDKVVLKFDCIDEATFFAENLGCWDYEAKENDSADV